MQHILVAIPTFRDNLSITFPRVKQSKKTLEDGADKLFHNVGNYRNALRNIP
jgi:hypothetical protein